MTSYRSVAASLLVLGASFGFAAACTDGSAKDSSETHFLASCDGECGPGTECVCGVCTRPCLQNHECTSLHESAVCTPRDTTGLSCDEAQPERVCDLQCAANSDCSALGADFACLAGRCRERRGEDAGTAPVEACLGGGTSTCSLEDTCATLERDFNQPCGGDTSLFDENACVRRQCERNGDCDAGEKCGFLPCVSVPGCEYDGDGVCGCVANTVCFPGAYCFAEESDVPAREWTSFTIDQGVGPCTDLVLECTWQWTVSRGGMLTTNKEGVMAQPTIAAADFAEIDGILSGEELLIAMIDGFSCDPPPNDVGFLKFTIELGSARYEQEVTGCVLTGPEGNEAERLWNLLRAY